MGFIKDVQDLRKELQRINCLLEEINVIGREVIVIKEEFSELKIEAIYSSTTSEERKKRLFILDKEEESLIKKLEHKEIIPGKSFNERRKDASKRRLKKDFNESDFK